MIPATQIHRRARQLGLDDAVVARDYVLCHVLAALAETGGGLVFRGGTALARVHWPDHRISEDLDFVTDREWESVRNIIARAVDVAGSRTADGVMIASSSSSGHRLRTVVRSARGEILVDVVRQTPMRAETARLHLPYSDLPDDLSIDVVAVEEILADKWFMLEDRDEPRDLFDLWTGLVAREIPFGSVADVHAAKHGYQPVLESLPRARRLRTGWSIRLAHQIPNLPDFDRVIDEVAAVAHAWRETSQ